MKPHPALSNCLLAIAPIMLVSLSSCNSNQDKATVDTKNEEPQITWDWKKHMRSTELTLQTLPVDIQPRQSLDIKSEATGILSLDVSKKVSTVTKGMAFARMDLDSLEEQGERLQIQAEKRTLEEMRSEKLELPEQRRLAKEELKEARRKVRLMEMILENPAMEEMSNELFGGNLGSVNKNTLRDAQDALALAEQKMAWADEYDEKLRKGQMRIQEMDFSKSERNYVKAKDRSIYEAPFDGELRLELDFVEGQKDYSLNSRESIATLNDYSEIHGLLKVSNAGWINLSPQRLELQIQDREKTLIPFFEDRIVKGQNRKKEERFYVFAIPLERGESLKRLTGTEMKGKLIYKLPEPCYIVPKYSVSLYALGKTDSTDWSEIVAKLWPSAEVLAEGLSDLAISYKN